MKQCKKITKLVVLLAAVFLCLGKHTDVQADTKLDSTLDNPVKGKLSKDDFETPEEWYKYLEEHPEESVAAFANGYPEEHIHATPEIAYTLKNLKSNKVIQAIYLDDEYLYVTQRVAASGFSGDTRVSRCKLNKETKEAVYQDQMILQNFGHGQTLEFYTYKEKTYMWISCKANTQYSNAWALQFGRLEYEAGKTVKDYTQIPRFADLAYANTGSKKFGDVKRIDVAMSTDETKLLLWAQDTNNNVQYSIYRTDVLNAYLDMMEFFNSKYISFSNNEVLQRACLNSFVQNGGDVVLPNGSNQGIELADDNSIYVIGGNTGEIPQIAVMKPNWDGSYPSYSTLITMIHEDYNGRTETEGMQLTHTGIYFGVVSHIDSTISDDTKEQFIYYIPYESIGQNAVHTETELRNAKAATCTESGYTGDVCCKSCGEVLTPGQVIAPLAHSYDAGVILSNAQVAVDGLKRYTCSICGGTLNEVIPKTGITPKKGTTLSVNGATYSITKKAANKTFTGGEVSYKKQTKKTKSVTIPKTIKVEGVTYKVTSIAKNAFKNRTDLTTLKVGANVKQIYGYAFYGCKKLKTITISTTALTSKKVGTKAFTGIPAKAKINVPNKKISSYRSIFRKKGLNKKVKVY